MDRMGISRYDMYQWSSTRRYDWMLTGSLWQAKKSFRQHGFCEVKSPFKSRKEGGLIHKIIRYILHLKNPITWSVIVLLSNHKNPIQEKKIEYHDLTPYSFKSKNIQIQIFSSYIHVLSIGWLDSVHPKVNLKWVHELLIPSSKLTYPHPRYI